MKKFMGLALAATVLVTAAGPALTATPNTTTVMQPIKFTFSAKTYRGYTYYLKDVGTGQILTEFNPLITPDSVTIGIGAAGTHNMCVDEKTNKGQDLGCIAQTTVTVN